MRETTELALIDLLIDFEREYITDCQIFFDIISGYKLVLEQEKSKLPYSINLLDEIHAKENAHSRILRKFLMFPEKRNGITKYPILELFFKYLGQPFADLAQIKPVITAEKARIDLLIYDRNYSIIIENKINGAGDQEEQLQRYVEKLTNDNIPEDNIYVLYLSANGGSPSESSWPDTIRKRFGCRYREINYRDDVYPFLKYYVIHYISAQRETMINEFMRSALHQYVDYLEGRFFYRKGELKMREKTQAYLEEKIGINVPSLSLGDKDVLIRDNIALLEEISASLHKTHNKLLNDCFNEAQKTICSLINPHVENIIQSSTFGHRTSRIQFNPEGWKKKYCISIVFDEEYEFFFLGIENTQSVEYNGPITDSVHKLLKKELGESDGPSNHWLYSVYIAEDRKNVMDYFSEVKNVTALSERIIHMAKNQKLREILQ